MGVDSLGWLLVWQGTVCTPETVWPEGFVLIRNREIADLGPSQELPDWVDVVNQRVGKSSDTEEELPREQCEPLQIVNAKGRYVTPGLIDIHIHGAMGYDVMEADGRGLARMAQGLASFGTTAFVPTTVSASLEEMQRVMAAASQLDEVAGLDNTAEPLGYHVEGPYINIKRKGAHEPSVIRDPKVAELKSLVDLAGAKLLTITLAPELPGAKEAISWLREQGIAVSLGHSTAEWSCVTNAISQGARRCTHLYNGMEPLHHRQPGLVGAALSDDRMVAELIVDNVHVELPVVDLTIKSKGWQRIALVSDGMQAVGLADGKYELGDLVVYVQDGACRLADGTIASSTVTLDRSVRILVQQLGISFQQAVAMASWSQLRPSESVIARESWLRAKTQTW